MRQKRPPGGDEAAIARFRERVARILDELASVQVIDVHQHVGSWASFGRAGGVSDPSVDVDPDARVRFMNSAGIDRAVLHPNPQAGNDAATVARANDHAVEMRSHHPEAFPAVAGSVPLADRETAGGELLRLARAGVFALTFHHRFIGRPLDHPIMDEVCESAEAQSWPIMAHCLAESTLSSLWRLGGLARRFPRVRFIALAALSAPSQAQQVLELGQERRNIDFEISLMSSVPAFVKSFCSTLGAERLLFGSDLYMEPHPIWDFPAGLLEVAAADISREDKALILGGNAARLLTAGGGK